MNAFEYIQELKNVIKSNYKQSKQKGEENNFISYKDHCSSLINMLNILETELSTVEYNYEIESIDGEIKTFDEMSFSQKELNDKVIIFQPIDLAENIDMESMINTLKKLKDAGLIEENILLVPPDVNIFRAKLATKLYEDADNKK